MHTQMLVHSENHWSTYKCNGRYIMVSYEAILSFELFVIVYKTTYTTAEVVKRLACRQENYYMG